MFNLFNSKKTYNPKHVAITGGTITGITGLTVVAGNLTLDNTTNANQYGVISKAGTRFIHNFNYGNNGTVTTDGGNTFVGVNAGNLTMGSTATQTYHASRNTASGLQALYSNTTGYYNTASGLQALYSNTTGYQNTASGLNALYFNTTGYYNTASGMNAGRYIADGATANQTSNSSLYLGMSTKALADGGSNEIVIGYNATGAGSNSVVLGNNSVTKTVIKGNIYNLSSTKAWAHVYNSGGTPVSGGTAWNVSSFTDNGVGDWTINWGVTLSDANKSCHIASACSASDAVFLYAKIRDFTTTSTRVQIVNSAGVLTDPDRLFVTLSGDIT